jgi:small subunit ribosomal protein S4
MVNLNLQTTPSPIPDFLEKTPGETPEGRVLRLPTRGDVDPRIQDIREQLIIEFCAR